MLGWIWKKGKAGLKTLYELPQTPLCIPQLDGTRVLIQLKTISVPEKKLGVYTCPMGNFSYHVAQLLTRDWNMARGLVHGGARPGMPGWVHAINYFSNLFVGLLQLLTHCRKWRKHFNPSGTNCYPPFMLTGTSLRSIV
jgi:hypothetical protein